MATLVEDNELNQIVDELRQDQEDELSGSIGSGGIGSGTTVASSSGGPQAQSAATGGVSNTARNIKKYIEANQGAGQQIAGAIGQRATDESGRIGSGIQRAQQDFESKTNPLQRELDESDPFIQSSFADPTTTVSQQDQLARFQRLRDNQIGNELGQVSVDIDPIQQSLDTVRGIQENLGSQEGRFQLLQDEFGNPTYTTGQKRLDQLLFQSDPNAVSGLQNQVAGLASSQQGQLDQFNQQSQAQMDALLGLAGDKQQGISDLLSRGSDLGGLEDDLTQRGYEDILNDITARESQREQDLVRNLTELQDTQGSLTNATDNLLNLLGIEKGSITYGVDPTKFGSSFVDPTALVTASGVSNPEEIARYQALNQLAGVDPQIILDAAQSNQTYEDLPGFQKDAFLGDLASRKAGFEGQFTLPAQDRAIIERFMTQGGQFGPYDGTNYSDEFRRNYEAFERAGMLADLDEPRNFRRVGFSEVNKGGGRRGIDQSERMQEAVNALTNSLRQIADSRGALEVAGGGSDADALFQQLLAQYGGR